MLAVDVGTSSVRAILHDERGRPVRGASAHAPYAPRVHVDGTAEVPVRGLVALVEECMDRVLAGRSEAIAAVGLSTFWHGLVGMRGGRPVTPVLLWSDSRSWRQAVRLRSELDAEAVRQRTGCPIHPSYWPAKLAWAHAAGIRAERWCSFGDLLQQRWFGDLRTSVSMASGTGLRRLREPAWDAALLDHLELAAAALPEVADGPARLPRRLARRWPALAGADFLPAAGDGALANLGSDCAEGGRRALTVGTSGALRAITTRVPAHLPPGLWCYRLDARRWVLGGSFSNGGNVHAWLLQTLRVTSAELERRLERARAGDHGLAFLPLLAGERSPGFAPRATGALAGLTLATTAADIAAAAMEALAVDVAVVDERLDEVAGRASLVVGSGAALAGSPGLAQAMADATGRRLLVADNPEASARGAALLALEHLGIRPAVPARPAGRTFVPRRRLRGAYRDMAEARAGLYASAVTTGTVERATPAHLRRPGAKESNGG